MYYNKHRLERSIMMLDKMLSRYDLTEPEKKYNFHGGRMVGYFQGKKEVYEDLLEIINEEEKDKE